MTWQPLKKLTQPKECELTLNRVCVKDNLPAQSYKPPIVVFVVVEFSVSCNAVSRWRSLNTSKIATSTLPKRWNSHLLMGLEKSARTSRQQVVAMWMSLVAEIKGKPGLWREELLSPLKYLKKVKINVALSGLEWHILMSNLGAYKLPM